MDGYPYVTANFNLRKVLVLILNETNWTSRPSVYNGVKILIL